ncbi:hypothetical protein ACFPPA_16695 [Rhodanobacter ginsengisoli]|uniref:Pyridoxamine 5'-phosphate oxidase putative domain-containing protein n=1 Tax=Rhodanobacter ginsengisoli TaxID=418646 RepID=A0ABW0QV05_9GAMM
MPSTIAPTVIDADNARFIAGGVSIIVSARNAGNRPDLVRAQGCRVARDRRTIRLFVVTAQAVELLADLRQNGRIAVVFTEPSSHRSLQLKGDDAAIVPLRRGDPARIAAYRDAMVTELARIGVSEVMTRALLAGATGEMVSIEFTLGTAFVQTPGPEAGMPLPQAS